MRANGAELSDFTASCAISCKPRKNLVMVMMVMGVIMMEVMMMMTIATMMIMMEVMMMMMTAGQLFS